jgi:hypothetical protein
MNAVLSPRFRYRYLPRILMGLGAVAVVGLGIWGATNLFTNSSGNPNNTPVSNTGGVNENIHPSAVKLDQAVMPVAIKFVNTAVARRNLAASYGLTSPTYKQGFSLKQWKTGNIPVIPFEDPIIAPKIQVDHSYKNDALIELALFSKTGKERPQVFYIQLHKYPRGAYGHHWLVTYWAPHGYSQVRSDSSGG